MMFVYSLCFLATVNAVSALHCHVNRTHTERCSSSFSYFFPVFCYNRTVETPEGKHHHSYGCADLKLRSMPVSKERDSYCFFPNNQLWNGHGKVCLCTTDKCNYIPHRKTARGQWYSSASLPSISLIYLAIFALL